MNLLKILILTLFTTISINAYCQDTTTLNLLGNWTYYKTTVENSNSIISGGPHYSYEFCKDAVYKLHYGQGKNKIIYQGTWNTDGRIIHLSANSTGPMDEGSLADEHDFTIIQLTSHVLILLDGERKLYFKKSP